ncbi:MAG: hypothetical protein JST19_00800 [Bacteroidetes bacterium]|nr:hypothetical protein [Bacteroidota bacterium]
MITKTRAFRRALINAIVLVLFIILSSQFYGTYWILILPAGFFVCLFFTIALIKNLIFWLEKKNDRNFSGLPFLTQVFAILMVCLIPSRERSKQHYLMTVKLPPDRKLDCPCHLYLEYYTVFGQGAWGADLNSEYLTDSLNFRKYLGTYDEANMPIRVICHQDTIKTEIQNEYPNIETKTYSLKALQTAKEFQ